MYTRWWFFNEFLMELDKHVVTQMPVVHHKISSSVKALYKPNYLKIYSQIFILLYVSGEEKERSFCTNFSLFRG